MGPVQLSGTDKDDSKPLALPSVLVTRVWLHLALWALLCVAIVGSVLHAGWPAPRVEDEFSYLLAAQTFAEGRLTNPTPAHAEFFESQHVLLDPTYQSKYPPGIGLQLAIGILLGDPIFGVWLTLGACLSLAFEGARRLMPTGWAFLTAAVLLLAYLSFNYQMVSYMGGSLFLLGGMAAFEGALGIWLRKAHWREGMALGVGWGIMSLARPFEGLLFALLTLGIIGWRMVEDPSLRAAIVRHGLIGITLAWLAVGFQLFYNFRVTGSPLQFPWSLYGEMTGRDLPVFPWGEMAVGESPSIHPELQSVRGRYEELMHKDVATMMGSRIGSMIAYFFPFLAVLPFAAWATREEGRGRAIIGVLAASALSVFILPLISFNLIHFELWERYILAWCWPGCLLSGTTLFYLFRHGRPRSLSRYVGAGCLIGGIVITSGRAAVFFSEPFPDNGNDLRRSIRDAFEAEIEPTGRRLTVFYDATADRNSLYRDFVHNGPKPFEQDILWARFVDPEANAKLLRERKGDNVWVLATSGPEGQLELFSYSSYLADTAASRAHRSD